MNIITRHILYFSVNLLDVWTSLTG